MVDVAGYLMPCNAQAANCQTTWLIPSAPSSSSKPQPDRNRQRDREHVMRPEVAHRTPSSRALPRISAGHRQTVMVIHDAPKILL